MFIDSAKLNLKAGNGGNGCVSFLKEKYVAAGGPDGGDGGRGGSIAFMGAKGMHTLSDFRYQTKYRAEHGENGKGGNCTGKSGKNLIIKVPLGTMVFNHENGKLVADITEDGQQVTIVKGGQGGAGNQRFATPTRQIPDFAKSGTKGEEMTVDVELKVLADVGLVGFPNVGKSTLLSMVSSARPKIADYHFTTLTPNLGVIDMGEGNSFVMADIPGLIEGAHQGAGLGDEFLRHIERTRLLVHVIDVAGTEGREPLSDFHTINQELRNYKIDLSDRPQIVAANKIDVLSPEEQSKISDFCTELEKEGYQVFSISAATGLHVRELLNAVWKTLSELPAVSQSIELQSDYIEYRLENSKESEKRFEIKVENGVYIVEGSWIEKLISDINFESHESLQYFQKLLKKYGIIESLEKQGIKEGDTVQIYDMEFDYIK